MDTDDTKLYFPVVTLSTRHNAKLLHQLKPGLKKTVNNTAAKAILKLLN